MKKGTLHLIPTPLSEPGSGFIFIPYDTGFIKGIQTYIVEDLRSARRFLKSVDKSIDIDSLTFIELNEHTDLSKTGNFLNDALQGKDIGLLSEAGLPCVADPGHAIVRLAHEKGILVNPLLGPSSLMMALMGSGFNGQSFIFHGYLPIKPSERQSKLKELERDCRKSNRTQIFIETPYRNLSLLDAIVQACSPDLLLCIAADITLPTQIIATKAIHHWKNNFPDLHKRPAVFLLGM